ncbi:MAG: SPOR domain-containing protein [Maricaulaceae bacterium]|nr:SPOR domain-containing protein [Maricaulaceae bacterium]
MIRLAAPALLFAVAACATLGESRIADPAPVHAAPVADVQSARLAETLAGELSRLAREDPGILDAAMPEMRALAAALAGHALAPETAPPPSPSPAGADAPQIAEPPPSAPAPESSAQASAGVYGVHLASYRLEAHAESGWTTLLAMFPDVLEGLQPRLAEADLGEQGVFLRLVAGPFAGHSAAEAACDALRAAGAWCAPGPFTGEPLADMPAR